MKLINYILVILLALFSLSCSNYAFSPETGSTLSNWSIARDYQAQGRFELARQYYALALADARTYTSQEALKQEIIALDRQIQAMR